MRGCIGGTTNKANGIGFGLGLGSANRRTISHKFGHFTAGTMAGIHRQKRHIRQFHAHIIGVIGSDTGWPKALQKNRFKVDKNRKGAGDITHRLASTDPCPFNIKLFDFQGGTAGLRHGGNPFDGQTSGKGNRTPHENRIGDFAITICHDDFACVIEIGIG